MGTLNRIRLLVFIAWMFSAGTYAQKNKPQKVNDDFEFSPATAHPKARALMKEDFYWSPIEETGPFGSDDGWDAAYGFRDWRGSHKTSSPVSYLRNLIEGWNYPPFDWYEMDSTKIREYISQGSPTDDPSIQQKMLQLKEALKKSGDSSLKNMDDRKLTELVMASSKAMGSDYLLGMDNAIIGTGFAQFALEGKIDKNLQALTMVAIKRELLPLLINRYDTRYRSRRTEQLTKMLRTVKKMNL